MVWLNQKSHTTPLMFNLKFARSFGEDTGKYNLVYHNY